MKKQRTEKTVRRSFIYMVKTSKIAVKQRKQRKKAPKIRCFLWQGQKDLNPRHAVLETAALPTELYPYIKFFLTEITMILYIYCIILSTIIISNCFYEAFFKSNTQQKKR